MPSGKNLLLLVFEIEYALKNFIYTLMCILLFFDSNLKLLLNLKLLDTHRFLQKEAEYVFLELSV